MTPTLDKFADAFSFLIAVGLPTLAAFGWLSYRTWAKHRTERLKLELAMMRERNALADAQDQRLDQRVAVLERIVTDRSALLGDEIERLRTAPLN